MAKKKSKITEISSEEQVHDSSTTLQSWPTAAAHESISSTSTTAARKQAKPQYSASALIICRNKHWRYISSFHGPWLQLPPEVLESLASNNFSLPRPRPIDPAVFFDLLKIRRLVDDATNLAVRAASGVTSASLSGALNAGNGLLGTGGTASGLGIAGGGSNAKLSRERKHRMREQATQKLSKAYHLDEIACSVATMQSASSIEDVAHLVLQRNPLDADAKYVHFFHEKIPSRQLAECTSLQPLDEVVVDRPSEAEILRTRAVTKMFKGDYVDSAQDLTKALQVCRYFQGQHKNGLEKLQLDTLPVTEAPQSHRWKEEVKVAEEDHPSSLEPQLLFHRAGVYLTIACKHINAALPTHTKKAPSGVSPGTESILRADNPIVTMPAEVSAAEKDANLQLSEARKAVKTNAKRALRDYIAFLAHLDYTPGRSAEITEDFVKHASQASNGLHVHHLYDQHKSLDLGSNASLSNGQLSDALVSHHAGYKVRYQPQTATTRSIDLPSLPSPAVYQISTLFSATPPSDLPPYPEANLILAKKQQVPTFQSDAAKAYLAQSECHEALTYHPLLTDALHSLLLCHCLAQTSARELLRHAHMVARLARVCDGYPIFQAARSPSRADWIEVVRRTDNWIQLLQPWDILCAPAPLPGQKCANEQMETTAEKRERLKQQAVMEALEDDRVHDEASFHAAFTARQRRQEEESRLAEGKEIPKRWAQEDGKEYPISTERAQTIARWVKEAPLRNDGTGRKKKRASKSKSNSQSAIGATSALVDSSRQTSELLSRKDLV